MTLAVERKEVDGRGSWSWASFRNDGMTMLKRGELTLLVQMAAAKSPDIPQVPLVMDYAKTDEQRQVLELLLAGQAMAWPVFAPAEVPPERVALLRKCLPRDAARIPETLADAKKLGVDVDPVPGDSDRRHAQARLRDAAGGGREGARARRPKIEQQADGVSMLRARLKIAIATLGADLALPSASAAQDFYAGKTVTIFRSSAGQSLRHQCPLPGPTSPTLPSRQSGDDRPQRAGRRHARRVQPCRQSGAQGRHRARACRTWRGH